MRIWPALLITMTFAANAIAADVNGRWIAEIKSPNGSVSERVFTFKVDGDKLTGTIANRQVAPAIFQETGGRKMIGTLKTQAAPAQEILEGKVSGNEISFVFMGRAQGRPARNIYTGKVSGDEVGFTMETKLEEGAAPAGAPGGAPATPPSPQQLVAKRAGASD